MNATAIVFTVLMGLEAGMNRRFTMCLMDLINAVRADPRISSPTYTPAYEVITLSFRDLNYDYDGLKYLYCQGLIREVRARRIELVTVVPVLIVPVIVPLRRITSLSGIMEARTVRDDLRLLLVVAISA